MFFAEIAQAMGTVGTDAAAQGQAGGAIASIVPLALMIVIFYFLLIRPQQKRAKEHKQMQSSLKVGDKVITAGGMYGEIVEMGSGDVVSVDLGGCKVKIARSYLSAVPVKAEQKSESK